MKERTNISLEKSTIHALDIMVQNSTKNGHKLNRSRLIEELVRNADPEVRLRAENKDDAQQIQILKAKIMTRQEMIDMMEKKKK